jgi:hypothetical protein
LKNSIEIQGGCAPESSTDNPVKVQQKDSALNSLPRANPREITPRIPDHELLFLIGQGAYGEVWLARNVRGTYRAVKIVFRGRFEDDKPYDREFRGIQKFEPVSRSHEGLVDILQVGRDEQAGYFYYIMELADRSQRPNSKRREPAENQKLEPCASSSQSKGPELFDFRTSDLYTPHSLREMLKCRGRLSVDECIKLGLSLAEALEHLHNNGLVHRDIKPSNIIFVEGVPKLADIGLVADLAEAKSFVGTVGYIPPEGPGTVQGDIYSLGKVLYEMSTGRDRQDFPQLPADLKAIPDRAALIEFNEILTRACEPEPSVRYASAARIRVDLELLGVGKSVKLRRAVLRVLRACRTVGLATLLLVLLMAAGGFIASRLRVRDQHSAVAGVETSVHLGNVCILSETPERLEQAKRYYADAIKSDPAFLPAYFGLFRVCLKHRPWGSRQRCS